MKYFLVLNDARAWEDAYGQHKMGWLRAGDKIAPVEEYDGKWLRFDNNVIGGLDLEPTDAQYKERWVSRDDVNLAEVVQSDSEQPTLAEIEKVVRWFRALWSSAKDAGLSSRYRGLESRKGYQMAQANG